MHAVFVDIVRAAETLVHTAECHYFRDRKREAHTVFWVEAASLEHAERIAQRIDGENWRRASCCMSD